VATIVELEFAKGSVAVSRHAATRAAVTQPRGQGRLGELLVNFDRGSPVGDADCQPVGTVEG
jgi:hypothetical protein